MSYRIQIGDARQWEGLTRRQVEVLAYIAHGLTNEQIAELLDISEQTVRIHATRAFAVVGVRNRTEAAIYAIQRGWVAVCDVAVGTEANAPAPGTLVEVLAAHG